MTRMRLSRYQRQMSLATVLVALGAPYVLLTNQTASGGVIAIHVLALWLFAPPFVTVAETAHARWSQRAIDASSPWSVALRVLSTWLGLLCGVLTMVLVVHVGTSIPLAELVASGLAAALVPLFSWYALVVLYDAWRDQRERVLRLAASESRAAWAALNAQFQPHFLFNSLASLEQLIDGDASRATVFLQRLSRLYRSMLASADAELRPLAEELDLARDYLEIQRVRFGPRLQIVVPSVDDALANVRVPAKLVLTLVENAMKHGIEQLPAGGAVHILVAADAREISLVVTNPIPEERSRKLPAVVSTSYGLRDLRERLRLAYGESARFDLTVAGSDARATLTLPLRARLT